MNTKSNATTILCYGDSNTWGQKPDKTGRYLAEIRWTGVLQQSLGDDYYVIEEGLSSRTTDLEYSRKLGRNGKTYLTPCIGSHNPLDIVILMLGTNDLKIEFNRSASQIALATAGLIEDIKNTAWDKAKDVPQIIVVSPILIDSHTPDFSNFYSENYNEESARKSEQLANEVKKITIDMDCHFIDAASVSSAGSDGIHFNEASHLALGKLLANYIQRLKV